MKAEKRKSGRQYHKWAQIDERGTHKCVKCGLKMSFKTRKAIRTRHGDETCDRIFKTKGGEAFVSNVKTPPCEG